MEAYSETLRGSAELVRALVERAETEQQQGNFSAARASLASAAVVDLSPWSTYQLGLLFAESGRFQEAIGQLELAWNHAKTLGSARWRAICCHALAEIYRRQGWEDLADRHRQWAYRAELEAGELLLPEPWFQDTARRAMLFGELDRAEQLLRLALRAAAGDSSAMLHNLAVVQYRQGRWAQAIRTFTKAFSRARSAKDLPGCARAVLNIGHVLQSQEKWAKASVCFCHARRLFQRLNARNGARQAQIGQSECDRFQAVFHAQLVRN